jgi:Tfp pilus assembly protein PilN
MIQINLLPLESFRQTYSGRLVAAIFGFAMVALATLLYLYYGMFMVPKMESAEKAQAAANAALTQAKVRAAEALKQTTSLVDDLVKVTVISELEERRRDQARLFMAIANQVFNEASWLISCSHDNGVVKIRGMASDHEVVAKFLDRLQEQPVLQNVDLVRTAEDAVINGVKLVTFDISASTTFQAPSLLTNGLPSEALPPQAALLKMVTAAAPNLAEALKPKDLKKRL